jgi:DNA-binding response OmpR family regulator
MLIVENEPVLVVMLQKFFVGRGYEVTVAKSYDEYRKQMSGVYDAAIIDCSLVGALNQDGLRIVRELKEAQTSRFTLMFTAIQDPEILQLAREAGAHHVLIKPVPLTHIERLIDERKDK